uniref:Chromosome segregation ATPase n=1 Tax=Vibrio mytili TaxID=50718 RepID=G8FT90_9VIBR|nr:chromosome segregation ATPase [Vibrio mytili]
MVSIKGLPPSLVPGANRTHKARKKKQVQTSQTEKSINQPSKVANAVAHSIKHVDESQLHHAHIQYDLPEGNGRRAMEHYMDVMNRARKEELAQLLGVDLYI